MSADINQSFRITIESYDMKISVEKPRSDLNIKEAMELVEQALLAVGYSKESIEEYFES